jgi:hypothetical protein
VLIALVRHVGHAPRRAVHVAHRTVRHVGPRVAGLARPARRALVSALKLGCVATPFTLASLGSLAPGDQPREAPTGSTANSAIPANLFGPGLFGPGLFEPGLFGAGPFLPEARLMGVASQDMTDGARGTAQGLSGELLGLGQHLPLALLVPGLSGLQPDLPSTHANARPELPAGASAGVPAAVPAVIAEPAGTARLLGLAVLGLLLARALRQLPMKAGLRFSMKARRPSL